MKINKIFYSNFKRFKKLHVFWRLFNFLFFKNSKSTEIYNNHEERIKNRDVHWKITSKFSIKHESLFQKKKLQTIFLNDIRLILSKI